jgi:uncharacterized membrane protein (UPF0127 family)
LLVPLAKPRQLQVWRPHESGAAARFSGSARVCQGGHRLDRLCASQIQAVNVAAKCYADASVNTVTHRARLSPARVALFGRGYWCNARNVYWRDRGEDRQHEDASTTRASRSPARRARGLSGRAALPTDGLWLVWMKPGPHPVWMRDMHFALDLIWCDRAGRVLAIKLDVPPCRMGAECPIYGARLSEASSVIELPSGSAARLGLKVGSILCTLERAEPHLSVPCETELPDRSGRLNSPSPHQGACMTN